MDCSICSSMPYMLRPPRNTICVACYEAVRTAIALVQGDQDTPDKAAKLHANSCNKPNPIANILTQLKEKKETEKELNEKINFLSGFVVALKDQIHTDIQLKPGNDGPSLPAHRALLASRSVIFKNMLDSDGCKAAPNEAVSLPELNCEELESLLEFLYSGSLAPDKLAKHVYSLSLAADKYEIGFLHKFCERHMLKSLSSSTALDVLEVSDVCSSETLKDTALRFTVKNMEEIVFSAQYDAFALKNPHLGVQITRASFMEAKTRSVD